MWVRTTRETRPHRCQTAAVIHRPARKSRVRERERGFVNFFDCYGARKGRVKKGARRRRPLSPRSIEFLPLQPKGRLSKVTNERSNNVGRRRSRSSLTGPTPNQSPDEADPRRPSSTLEFLIVLAIRAEP